MPKSPGFASVGAPKWRAADHPRDRLGRFIETGAEVRTWTNALARVIGMSPNGRVIIEREDGKRQGVAPSFITVIKRPDGGKPSDVDEGTIDTVEDVPDAVVTPDTPPTISGVRRQYGAVEVGVEPYLTTDRDGQSVLVEGFSHDLQAITGTNPITTWGRKVKKDGTPSDRRTMLSTNAVPANVREAIDAGLAMDKDGDLDVAPFNEPAAQDAPADTATVDANDVDARIRAAVQGSKPQAPAAPDAAEGGDLTWEQVKDKYPAYAAPFMDSAVNEFNDDGTGTMTTQDLRFTEETVDLRDVRFQRYDATDERVASLRDGYAAGADVPPVLLVRRNGELHTVDGHHRLSEQEQRGETQVRAVIAHSTLDTPYTGKVSIGEVAGRGDKPEAPEAPQAAAKGLDAVRESLRSYEVPDGILRVTNEAAKAKHVAAVRAMADDKTLAATKSGRLLITGDRNKGFTITHAASGLRIYTLVDVTKREDALAVAEKIDAIDVPWEAPTVMQDTRDWRDADGRKLGQAVMAVIEDHDSLAAAGAAERAKTEAAAAERTRVATEGGYDEAVPASRLRQGDRVMVFPSGSTEPTVGILAVKPDIAGINANWDRRGKVGLSLVTPDGPTQVTVSDLSSFHRDSTVTGDEVLFPTVAEAPDGGVRVTTADGRVLAFAADGAYLPAASQPSNAIQAFRGSDWFKADAVRTSATPAKIEEWRARAGGQATDPAQPSLGAPGTRVALADGRTGIVKDVRDDNLSVQVTPETSVSVKIGDVTPAGEPSGDDLVAFDAELPNRLYQHADGTWTYQPPLGEATRGTEEQARAAAQADADRILGRTPTQPQGGSTRRPRIGEAPPGGWRPEDDIQMREMSDRERREARVAEQTARLAEQGIVVGGTVRRHAITSDGPGKVLGTGTVISIGETGIVTVEMPNRRRYGLRGEFLSVPQADEGKWQRTGRTIYPSTSAAKIGRGDVIYTTGDGTFSNPVEVSTARQADANGVLSDRYRVPRTVDRIERVDRGEDGGKGMVVHFTDGTSTGAEGGSVQWFPVGSGVQVLRAKDEDIERAKNDVPTQDEVDRFTASADAWAENLYYHEMDDDEILPALAAERARQVPEITRPPIYMPRTDALRAIQHEAALRWLEQAVKDRGLDEPDAPEVEQQQSGGGYTLGDTVEVQVPDFGAPGQPMVWRRGTVTGITTDPDTGLTDVEVMGEDGQRLPTQRVGRNGGNPRIRSTAAREIDATTDVDIYSEASSGQQVYDLGTADAKAGIQRVEPMMFPSAYERGRGRFALSGGLASDEQRAAALRQHADQPEIASALAAYDANPNRENLRAAEAAADAARVRLSREDADNYAARFNGDVEAMKAEREALRLRAISRPFVVDRNDADNDVLNRRITALDDAMHAAGKVEPIEGPEQPDTEITQSRAAEITVGQRILLPDGTPANVDEVVTYDDDVIGLTYTDDRGNRGQWMVDPDEMIDLGDGIPVDPRQGLRGDDGDNGEPALDGGSLTSVPQPTSRANLRNYQRAWFGKDRWDLTHPDATTRRAARKVGMYENLTADEADALADLLDRVADSVESPRTAAARRKAAFQLRVQARSLRAEHEAKARGIKATAGKTVKPGARVHLLAWGGHRGVKGEVVDVKKVQGSRALDVAVMTDDGRLVRRTIMRGSPVVDLGEGQVQVGQQVAGIDIVPGDRIRVTEDGVPVDITVGAAVDGDTFYGITDDGRRIGYVLPEDETEVLRLSSGADVEDTGKPERRTAGEVGMRDVITYEGTTGEVVNYLNKAGVVSITVETSDDTLVEIRTVESRSVWVHPPLPEPEPIITPETEHHQPGERPIKWHEIEVGDRVTIRHRMTNSESVGTVYDVTPDIGEDDDGNPVPGVMLDVVIDGTGSRNSFGMWSDEAEGYEVTLMSRGGAAEIKRRMAEEEIEKSVKRFARTRQSLSRGIADSWRQRGGTTGYINVGGADALDVRRQGYEPIDWAADNRVRIVSDHTTRTLNSLTADLGLDSDAEKVARERLRPAVEAWANEEWERVVSAYQSASPLPGETPADLDRRVHDALGEAVKQENDRDRAAFVALARAEYALSRLGRDDSISIDATPEAVNARAAAAKVVIDAEIDAVADQVREWMSGLTGNPSRVPDVSSRMGDPLGPDWEKPGDGATDAVLAAVGEGYADRIGSMRSEVDSTLTGIRRGITTYVRNAQIAPGQTWEDNLAAAVQQAKTDNAERAANQAARTATHRLGNGGDRIIPELDSPTPLSDEDAPTDPVERIAYWSAALPADRGNFGMKVYRRPGIVGEVTAEDLANGVVPEVGWVETYRRDVAEDGLMGETAMRHLHAMQEVGKAVDEMIDAEAAAMMSDLIPTEGMTADEYDAELAAREEALLDAKREAYAAREQALKDLDARYVAEHDLDPSAYSMDKVVNALRSKYRGDDSVLMQYASEKRALDNPLYEATSALEEAKSARRTFEKARWDRKRQASLTVMSRLRPHGRTEETPYSFYSDARSPQALRDKDPKVREMTSAMDHYPTAWLRHGKSPLALGVDRSGGGTYYQYGHLNRQMPAINLQTSDKHSADWRREVAIHEFGHHMERKVPGLVTAERTFYDKRTSEGEIGSRVREGKNALTVAKEYGTLKGRKVMVREDEFSRRYAGRDYSDRTPDTEAWELFTTGIEGVYGVGHASDVDPDFRAFVLGALVTLGDDDPDETPVGQITEEGLSRALAAAIRNGDTARVAALRQRAIAMGRPDLIPSGA